MFKKVLVGALVGCMVLSNVCYAESDITSVEAIDKSTPLAMWEYGITGLCALDSVEIQMDGVIDAFVKQEASETNMPIKGTVSGLIQAIHGGNFIIDYNYGTDFIGQKSSDRGTIIVDNENLKEYTNFGGSWSNHNISEATDPFDIMYKYRGLDYIDGIDLSVEEDREMLYELKTFVNDHMSFEPEVNGMASVSASIDTSLLDDIEFFFKDLYSRHGEEDVSALDNLRESFESQIPLDMTNVVLNLNAGLSEGRLDSFTASLNTPLVINLPEEVLGQEGCILNINDATLNFKVVGANTVNEIVIPEEALSSNVGDTTSIVDIPDVEDNSIQGTGEDNLNIGEVGSSILDNFGLSSGDDDTTNDSEGSEGSTYSVRWGKTVNLNSFGKITDISKMEGSIYGNTEDYNDTTYPSVNLYLFDEDFYELGDAREHLEDCIEADKDYYTTDNGFKNVEISDIAESTDKYGNKMYYYVSTYTSNRDFYYSVDTYIAHIEMPEGGYLKVEASSMYDEGESGQVTSEFIDSFLNAIEIS